MCNWHLRYAEHGFFVAYPQWGASRHFEIPLGWGRALSGVVFQNTKHSPNAGGGHPAKIRVEYSSSRDRSKWTSLGDYDPDWGRNPAQFLHKEFRTKFGKTYSAWWVRITIIEAENWFAGRFGALVTEEAETHLPEPMETVYFGTANGHLHALDAHSGVKVFDQPVTGAYR